LAGRKADYVKIADKNVMHGQNPKIMLPIRPVPYGSGNYIEFPVDFPLIRAQIHRTLYGNNVDCMHTYIYVRKDVVCLDKSGACGNEEAKFTAEM
jgi:hypothetical protein